jgi:hypothetical protein
MVREPDATQMRSSYRVCRCSGVIEPAGSQLSVKSWRPPVSAPAVRMVTRTRSGPRTNWRSRMSGLVVVMVAPPVGIVGIDPSLAGKGAAVVGPGRTVVDDPCTAAYPGLGALPIVLRYSSGGTP